MPIPRNGRTLKISWRRMVMYVTTQNLRHLMIGMSENPASLYLREYDEVVLGRTASIFCHF